MRRTPRVISDALWERIRPWLPVTVRHPMGGHLVFPLIGTLAYSNLPLVQETGNGVHLLVKRHDSNLSATGVDYTERFVYDGTDIVPILDVSPLGATSGGLAL